MIAHVQPLYRPPSEAESLIFQVTVGCSYNRCSFCGMYRSKRFRIRPLEELEAEIAWAKQRYPETRKVFLGDGDGLIAPARLLGAVLERLDQAFPLLRRVSIYASPQSLEARSVEQMRDLREAGLTLYYLGIESGHEKVLETLVKGVDAERMTACALKAQAAGVQLSTMILLGAGGRSLSREHARESARVVSAINPRYLSTLVMTPVEQTPLFEQAARGEFEALSPTELASELREFVAHLEVERTIFRANHASNYLPLAGTLSRDKARLIRQLDQVLSCPDEAPFRPEWMRGL